MVDKLTEIIRDLNAEGLNVSGKASSKGLLVNASNVLPEEFGNISSKIYNAILNGYGVGDWNPKYDGQQQTITGNYIPLSHKKTVEERKRPKTGGCGNSFGYKGPVNF